MNANQIVNMVTRMFVRKAVKTGVDAGFKQVEKMRKPVAMPEAGQSEHDIVSETSGEEGPSREEIRKARRERQAIREKRRARRARKEQNQSEA